MRAAALLACLVIAGCANKPRVPERIEIPVPVPCRVQVPTAPVWATETLQPGAGIFDQVRALLAERAQRISHITRLEAAARACQ